MKQVKYDNMIIEYGFRLPKEEHPDYIVNLIRCFGVHYMNYLNKQHNWGVNRMEICKQDIRGALSVTVYRDNEHVKQEWHGYTPKELIKFMQGFIFDKPWVSANDEKAA